MAMMFMNLFMLVYQGYFMPIKMNVLNRIECFNELCITFSTLHMLYFTDWVLKPETKFYYGWHLDAVIVFNILVNLIVILYNGFNGIRLLLHKQYNKFRVRF